MTYRLKINPPNDFWMNILEYPPEVEDFASLKFPGISNVWLDNPEEQLNLLVHQFLRDFEDIQTL